MSQRIHNSVIRDSIEGNRLISVSKSILSIVDSEEFQRLRSIRQMGLASHVFPTAEHSRFSHSLGVYATAMAAFHHLRDRAAGMELGMRGVKFDDDLELDFCIAAMCHDIGHTAFSHVLEQILLPEGCLTHEDCSILLIESETEISKRIRNAADIDSVLLLLRKQHPNSALNDLISSAFDVDRSDYVIRDGAMSGVEYGQFDLKWLLHALTVKKNRNSFPILILDGPRGLDALRQFLSARRYLHRQVYFHRSVRSAQALLKSIFNRIQDIGASRSSKKLIPSCLAAVMEGRRLTLSEFRRCTDVEVTFMLKEFAVAHSDKCLRYLCTLFLSRRLPKCVVDSSANNSPLSLLHPRLAPTEAPPESSQIEMTELFYRQDEELLNELTNLVASKLPAIGAPKEAAKYLTILDDVKFVSNPPTNLLFSFGGETVPLEAINRDCVGFAIADLIEAFTIRRLFVPGDLVDDVKEFLEPRGPRG